MTPLARRRVVVRAPGKINLSLAVGRVDEHGYHALATVFQAVDLYETVTAVRADRHDVGGAVAQLVTTLRHAHLHDVQRELARRVVHRLQRRGGSRAIRRPRSSAGTR